MTDGCLSAISIAKEDANKLGIVIRIDLGTTYSCVGVYKNGHVEIIANDQGNRITPSWVAFTDSERLIAEVAKNQASVNTERTVFEGKRLIGRKFEDKEVQRDMKLGPYKIMNKDGKPYIQVQLQGEETKLSAGDKGTGKAEKITITNENGRLSQEEIERMVREAEEFAEEDKKVKEKIDACTALETYMYNMKNQVSDKDKLADKLEGDEKENIEAATKEALEWLDENQSAQKEEYDEKLTEVEAV
ncbi:luminal binding protein [Tanacetum coccineum]